MTRVFLSDDLTLKLPSLGEFLEICDSSGRIVGRYNPVKPGREIYEKLEPLISEEELDRRERIEGGRTLREIMADLEKRQ